MSIRYTSKHIYHFRYFYIRTYNTLRYTKVKAFNTQSRETFKSLENWRERARGEQPPKSYNTIVSEYDKRHRISQIELGFIVFLKIQV